MDTRPKIESRFEDVNVLDTVRNYSIGTFIWGSPIVFFVWGLPYSSNQHVTPVPVRGRKDLTCSIRAPHCPRFDTLRQSVSNRAQLFLAVYGTGITVSERSVGRVLRIEICFRACIEARYSPLRHRIHPVSMVLEHRFESVSLQLGTG